MKSLTYGRKSWIKLSPGDERRSAGTRRQRRRIKTWRRIERNQKTDRPESAAEAQSGPDLGRPGCSGFGASFRGFQTER